MEEMMELFTVYAYKPDDASSSDLGIQMFLSREMTEEFEGDEDDLKKVIRNVANTILAGLDDVEVGGDAVPVNM